MRRLYDVWILTLDGCNGISDDGGKCYCQLEELVNVNKKEAKRLDELVAKLRKQLDFANNVHTSPIQIGNKDLADAIYYLDMLREELNYRVDHYVSEPTHTIDITRIWQWKTISINIGIVCLMEW